jgi:hypothetical protein
MLRCCDGIWEFVNAVFLLRRKESKNMMKKVFENVFLAILLIAADIEMTFFLLHFCSDSWLLLLFGC